MLLLSQNSFEIERLMVFQAWLNIIKCFFVQGALPKYCMLLLLTSDDPEDLSLWKVFSFLTCRSETR